MSLRSLSVAKAAQQKPKPAIVQIQTVWTPPSDIPNILQVLELPVNVIKAIETATYKGANGERIPLFYTFNPINNTKIWNIELLCSIIHEYDIYSNNINNLLTGNEFIDEEIDSNTPLTEPTKSSEMMINYILAMGRKTKIMTAKDTNYEGMLLFESATLEEHRKEETLAYALSRRTKVRMNNIECPKCHMFEVYATQSFSRSGDEGAVQAFECAKCGNKWKIY